MNTDTNTYTETHLWTVATVTFGFGDIVTTLAFVAAGLAVEAHPLSAAIMSAVGLWVIVPWKAVVLGGFFSVSRWVPREWRVGVPIGLSVVGSVVVGWNLAVGGVAVVG